MRTRRAFVRIFVASMAASLAGPLPSAHAQFGTDPLAEDRRDKRLFILFSPSEADARLTAATGALASRRCSLADRDIVVAIVPGDGTGRVGERPLTRSESDALRARHGVGADAFAFVLVGKDGGEKLRTSGVPPLDEVFARIDGMPMRRAEITDRPGACD
jgi:hypothetical protein